MAKPLDKEDKNPNSKKIGLDLSPNMIMMLNNIVTLVVIIISMIVMYSLMNSSIDKKIAKLLPEAGQEELDEDEPKQEGVLLDLGDFILNLADAGHRRYLKVGIAMELSKTEEESAAAAEAPKASGGHGGHGEAPAPVDPNEAIIAEMERYKPAIRDAVISVLSNKTSDELSSPTGKELAKEEILEMVNGIFDGKREVLRVSFGQFIIQ